MPADLASEVLRLFAHLAVFLIPVMLKRRYKSRFAADVDLSVMSDADHFTCVMHTALHSL